MSGGLREDRPLRAERGDVRTAPRLDRAKDFLGPRAAVARDLDPLKGEERASEEASETGGRRREHDDEERDPDGTARLPPPRRDRAPAEERLVPSADGHEAGTPATFRHRLPSGRPPPPGTLPRT